MLDDSRDANTGAGQDFTGLAAAVQLRLRVAVLADGRQGLQALRRCSGLVTAEQGAAPWRPTISASVVKLLSSSASNGEFAGGSPAECANSAALVQLQE